MLLSCFLDEKIAIVGHGLGGLVGFYFAVQQPGSVDHIMTVNCPMDFDSINVKLKTSTAPGFVEWRSSRTPKVTTALSDASKSDPRAIIASMSGFPADGLFQKFHETDMPCLLVYEQYDPLLTIPPIENAASMSQHLHQISLENSGHFPMIDETARFNRLLTDFLAIDSGMSPRELQMKEEWRQCVR